MQSKLDGSTRSGRYQQPIPSCSASITKLPSEVRTGEETAELACPFQPKINCNHTCAFLRRPPVLPPKIGDGVLGSRVGGFHGVFSFFSSATALLRDRALRGTGALLRSAVPLNTLWREGSAHEDAADIIVEAIAAVSADLGANKCSLQCATGITERVSLLDKWVPI